MNNSDIPLSQKVAIHVSKYMPSIVHKTITTNICSEWKTGGKNKIVDFIKDYNIDWREAKKCIGCKTLEECANKFESKNDFFQRELKPGIIQIDYTNNVLVSPSDSSLVVYRTELASKIYWIKGKGFTKEKLVNNKSLSETLNGPLFIFRLAPRDYHRFHFPLDSIYLGGYGIKGEYYSVDPILINSDIDSLGENKRQVHLFHNELFGTYCIVVVGATCTGSIEMNNLIIGKKYKKGDLLGMFGFGGSTLVLLLSKSLKVEEKFIKNSLKSRETYVRVGSKIGEI
jgi:phosphatidylserine decarboxylase